MRRSSIVALVSLAVGGCGGGDGTGPKTPTVASVSVTPTTATVSAGATTQLSATALDASGKAVAGYTVAWSTSAAAVATVSTTGLVTGVAAGSATITATSEGKSGTATITVVPIAFSPSAPTTLSGSQSFTTITIPAGVTVTLSSDLVLNASDSVVIAGTISGDCKKLTINSATTVDITGTIANDCAATPGSPAPTLTIFAKGGTTISGAVTSSGDVTITDDTTLTDTHFSLSAPPVAYAAVEPPTKTVCLRQIATNFFPFKKSGRDGTSGAHGTDGDDGATLRIRCVGDIDIGGGVRIAGQDGGRGGDGTDNSASADASGGNGGAGGTVKIMSDGDITFHGGNEIDSGDGGAGGDATATASASGGSANAIGGKGGNSSRGTERDGPVYIRAANINVLGELHFVVGDGGKGGFAKAVATNGKDADATSAAQPGGSATAKSGVGGSSIPMTLTATGSVAGTNLLVVLGGNAGSSDVADARAGNGGKGSQQFPLGARGGDQTVVGGAGGNAGVKDLLGNLTGNGGNGGAAFFAKGNGGLGFDGCSVKPPVAGGDGGGGGSAGGTAGAGGTGKNKGAAGQTAINNVGNGANGGNGNGAGKGGKRGSTSISFASSDVVSTPPNFTDGADGILCPTVTVTLTPATQTVPQGGTGSVQATVTPSNGATGPFTLTVKDQTNTARGSGTLPGAGTRTVTFTVPSAAATGTNTWSLTVSNPGVGDVVTPFVVTVTIATATQSYQNCDPSLPITDAFFYDGANPAAGFPASTSAAWARLPVLNQTISWKPTAPIGALLIVRSNATTSNIDLWFNDANGFEQLGKSSCEQTSPNVTAVFSLSPPLVAGQTSVISMKRGARSVTGPVATLTIPGAITGPQDIVASRQTGGVTDALTVLRNRVFDPLGGPIALPFFGEGTQTSFAKKVFFIAGAAASDQNAAEVLLRTSGGTSGIVARSAFAQQTSFTLVDIPPSSRAPGDLSELIALNQSSQYSRQVISYQKDFTDNSTMTLPAAPSLFTLTRVGTPTQVAFQVAGSLVLTDLAVLQFSQTVSGVQRNIQVYYPGTATGNATTFSNWGFPGTDVVPYSPNAAFVPGVAASATLLQLGSNIPGGVFSSVFVDGQQVSQALVGRTIVP